jgi:hypothetical protein
MSKTYLACKEVSLDVTVGIRIRLEVKLCVFEENDQLFLEATSKGVSKSWPLNANQCVRMNLSGVQLKICIQGRDATSVRIQPKVTLPPIGDVNIGGGVVIRFGPIPQNFDRGFFLKSNNAFDATASGHEAAYYAFFEDVSSVNEDGLVDIELQ